MYAPFGRGHSPFGVGNRACMHPAAHRLGHKPTKMYSKETGSIQRSVSVSNGPRLSRLTLHTCRYPAARAFIEKHHESSFVNFMLTRRGSCEDLNGREITTMDERALVQFSASQFLGAFLW